MVQCQLNNITGVYYLQPLAWFRFLSQTEFGIRCRAKSAELGAPALDWNLGSPGLWPWASHWTTTKCVFLLNFSCLIQRMWTEIPVFSALLWRLHENLNRWVASKHWVSQKVGQVSCTILHTPKQTFWPTQYNTRQLREVDHKLRSSSLKGPGELRRTVRKATKAWAQRRNALKHFHEVPWRGIF